MRACSGLWCVFWRAHIKEVNEVFGKTGVAEFMPVFPYLSSIRFAIFFLLQSNKLKRIIITILRCIGGRNVYFG